MKVAQRMAMGVLVLLSIALATPDQVISSSRHTGRSSHKGTHSFRHSRPSIHSGYGSPHSQRHHIRRGHRYERNSNQHHRRGVHRPHHRYRTYNIYNGTRNHLRYGPSRHYNHYSRHGRFRGHYYAVPGYRENPGGYGKLTLAIQPPDARVFLNGAYLGEAHEVNEMLILIEAGKHELLLSAGEEEVSYSLDVKVDSHARFEMDLFEE